MLMLARRIHEVARLTTSYGLPMRWLIESSLWPHRRWRKQRRGQRLPRPQHQRLPRPQHQRVPRPWAAVQVLVGVVEAAKWLRSP